jgi:DNA repair exonuclease SbcCD ATPase subunit
MNELQIRLTADIKGLQSAINKAKQTLESFESSANADQLAKFNAELEQTNQELARISASGKTFANTGVQSFNKFRVSAGAANSSVLAFSRIIQDAPFGIIGVANNIQQLTEQLGALKTTSGGTGAALRSFFTSLVSPANIAILAVSAVTAAWSAYSLGLFGAKKETEEANDSLEKYIQTLNGVEKATLDSTISIDQEIFKFDSLVSVLNDANSSYRQKKNAVDQIQSGYGEYLGNLTNEEILVNGLGKAYQNVIDALIAKQALEANAKEINANLKQTAELEKKRNSEELRYIELQVKRSKAEAQKERTQELINEGVIKGTKTLKENQALIDEITNLQNEYNISIDSSTTAIDKNKASLKTLIDGYTGSLKALLSYQTEVDNVKESSEGLNRVFDQNILFLERFGNEADNNKKKIEGLGESLAASLEQTQKNLFNSIAALKQNPTAGFNAALIQIYTKELEKIDSLIGSIASKRQSSPEFKVDESQLIGLELPTKQAPGLVQEFEDEIARLQQLIKVTTDPQLLNDYQEQLSIAQSGLSALLDKNILKVEDLAQAFTGLGSVIGRAFNNPQLGTFLGQFAQFVAKIVAGSFAVAKANAVAGATQSSLFTGPAAAFTLPAFIASSVGLVASAFAALGNFGGGGGGGSVSAGSGSTFTNRREFGGPVSKGRAYIVGERRPELFVPNTNGVIVPQVPSMDYSGASVSSGMYGVEVMLKGPDDLLFFVEQAQVRRNIR